MAQQQQEIFDESDSMGFEVKKLRHVFSEKCKNCINEKSNTCAVSVYYKTERGNKLCGVCVHETRGEMFSFLSIVRSHISDRFNALSLGHCDDCGTRLYQLVAKDVCLDCRKWVSILLYWCKEQFQKLWNYCELEEFFFLLCFRQPETITDSCLPIIFKFFFLFFFNFSNNVKKKHVYSSINM